MSKKCPALPREKWYDGDREGQGWIFNAVCHQASAGSFEAEENSFALVRVTEIYDMLTTPDGWAVCKDCPLLDNLT
jgi:hypothetical protein